MGKKPIEKSEKVALEATEFYNTHLNGSTTYLSAYSEEDQQRINEYYNEQSNESNGYAPENNNSSTMTVNNNGVLNISFPGQWFLVDAKTKIYVDGNLHSPILQNKVLRLIYLLRRTN